MYLIRENYNSIITIASGTGRYLRRIAQDKKRRTVNSESRELLIPGSLILPAFNIAPAIYDSILQTCQRVYDEAMPILYSGNSFLYKCKAPPPPSSMMNTLQSRFSRSRR